MTGSNHGILAVSAVAAAASMLFVAGMMDVPSSAHTTIHVEQYAIEVGWEIEPPIVGIRNSLFLKIVETGDTEGTYKGITGAFKDMKATAVFGGVTKEVDVNSDPRLGYYLAPIIPTRTGSYAVELRGDILGTPVDAMIPIEDVMSSAILDFPSTTSGGDKSGEIAALKNAISSLQQDVLEIKTSGMGGVNDGGGDGGSGNNTDGGASSYDIAFFSLSIGAAAIILSVIAMVKRK